MGCTANQQSASTQDGRAVFAITDAAADMKNSNKCKSYSR